MTLHLIFTTHGTSEELALLQKTKLLVLQMLLLR